MKNKNNKIINVEYVVEDLKEEEKTKDVKSLPILDTINKRREEKLNLYMDIEHNLLSFVQTQIKRIEAGNDLKNSAIQVLLDRILNSPDTVDDVILLKIVEIMEKTDTEKTNNILNVFSEIVKSSNIVEALRFKAKEETVREDRKAVSEQTKKDVEQTKKALKLIEMVEKLGRTEL